MGVTVKVGPKYQVVIPKELRKKLRIKPKDKVLVEEIEGMVIVIPKPKSFTGFLKGLGKEVWEGEDTTDYVKGERRS
ncbi:MAG: AbrB family transcriptional regulator [Candidatus Dadabacteria bacterium]